jgi:PTH1 family peptidyl-tRNA hydrolase
MSARKLVVGLGNPGQKYQDTPHNLGFEVVDRLASENRMVWSPGDCAAWVADGEVEGTAFVLLKPWTYMNLSGRSVGAALEQFSFSTDDLVVVCDDLALPLGKIRIRGKGSAGGHNGLRSIIESIDRTDFVRVRLGILPEFEIEDATEYVLRPIPCELREPVEKMIDRGKEAVKMIGGQGLLPAMNHFN